MSTTSLETSFTLADTFTELADPKNAAKWTETARRQMAEALKRVAKLLNKQLSELPANELQIDGIMRTGLHWQRDGFANRRTLTNLCARVKKAVRETRPGGMPSFTRRAHYSPGWRSLFAALEAHEKPHVTRSLAHLAGYANWRGLEPGEIDSAVLADLVALHAATKRAVNAGSGLKADDYARKAIDAALTWNSLVRQKNQKPWLRDLPATVLSWEGRRQRVNLPLEAYPESFQEDVARYLAHLRGCSTSGDATPAEDGLEEFAAPDPEALANSDLPDIVFPGQRLVGARRKTIKTRQWAILQTAGALVRWPEKQPDEIASLKDITTARALKISLTDYKKRQEAKGTWDPTAASRHHLGRYLIWIGEWCGQPADELEKMKSVIGLPTIKTNSVGNMSENRRELLEQFDQPWALRAWFDLPDHLFDQAEGKRRKTGAITQEMISDVEISLICGVFGILPARRSNACTLRYKGDNRSLFLARHFHEKSWIIWEPEEVKNDRRLRAEFVKSAEKKARVYMAHYRPRYLELHPETPDSDFLFPGTVNDEYGAGHRDLGRMGANFRDRAAAAGLDMTMHLARHLAAQIILDLDPTMLPTVAQLLGDTIETTRRFYVEGRTQNASRLYREILEKRAQQIVREWVDFDVINGDKR